MKEIVKDLELEEKYKKLKKKANEKPFRGKYRFKGKKPRVSAKQGIKVIKGLGGY